MKMVVKAEDIVVKSAASEANLAFPLVSSSHVRPSDLDVTFR